MTKKETPIIAKNPKVNFRNDLLKSLIYSNNTKNKSRVKRGFCEPSLQLAEA